jgi:hypothetical protein
LAKPPKKTRCDSQKKWFEEFSKDGEKLSEQQVKSLAYITRDWKLGEKEILVLSICAKLWYEHPYLFCDGPRPVRNIILRCCNDLQRMRETDPTRRKVLLIILSGEVEREQHNICKDGTKRWRPRSKKSECCRESSFVTSSLRALSLRLWIEVGESERKKCTEWLSKDSRYGCKWRNLRRLPIILSLHHARSKS